MLHDGELEFIGMTWGYRTPKEAGEKKKPWICARIEKARTGRYFRHMFREGRVIIPCGGWYEWTVEGGKKQPWYITRKVNEPIFMAGLTNFKPYIHQTADVGFVIVTEDSGAEMVDVHNRRPVGCELQENSYPSPSPDSAPLKCASAENEPLRGPQLLSNLASESGTKC
jgi:putative SOS response-associated peptidase YedK